MKDAPRRERKKSIAFRKKTIGGGQIWSPPIVFALNQGFFPDILRITGNGVTAVPKPSAVRQPGVKPSRTR